MSPDIKNIHVSHADPDDPDARACLRAYFQLLAARIDGISGSHVPDPDPEADKYRPPHGTILLAYLGDRPVGCVALKELSPGVGEIKRLWVDASARGHGLARRLMRLIEDEARAMGHTRLQLDTNAALIEAITLYRADGWTDIPAYTNWPGTHWFGKVLT